MQYSTYVVCIIYMTDILTCSVVKPDQTFLFNPDLTKLHYIVSPANISTY